jgi:hypothetical protein
MFVLLEKLKESDEKIHKKHPKIFNENEII